MCALSAFGQDAKPPATAPAAPTPKAVAAAFAATVDKGDADAALKLTAPDQQALTRATVTLAGRLKKLESAAVAKFGESARRIAQGRLHLEPAFKALEGATEKIEGESATVSANGNGSLRLRKVEGQWRVTWGLSAEDLARQVALYERLGEAAEQTAGEIAADSYETLEAAAKAFASRALAIRASF